MNRGKRSLWRLAKLVRDLTWRKLEQILQKFQIQHIQIAVVTASRSEVGVTVPNHTTALQVVAVVTVAIHQQLAAAMQLSHNHQ